MVQWVVLACEAGSARLGSQHVLGLVSLVCNLHTGEVEARAIHMTPCLNERMKTGSGGELVGG